MGQGLTFTGGVFVGVVGCLLGGSATSQDGAHTNGPVTCAIPNGGAALVIDEVGTAVVVQQDGSYRMVLGSVDKVGIHPNLRDPAKTVYFYEGSPETGGPLFGTKEQIEKQVKERGIQAPPLPERKP